ncbi:RCC1 domain-containing protein [Polyangium sorediatum]|uniref:BNR repeat domain protein n=1 Tax=Polyangium sorediatum TaxID=889274 RepID=A0ABT6P1J1_9BACT|nr:hypothetical protein [Polyangium sorediatum]MDI1434424.1 hypothetical protein [Polyangium sorediatum]
MRSSRSRLALLLLTLAACSGPAASGKTLPPTAPAASTPGPTVATAAPAASASPAVSPAPVKLGQVRRVVAGSNHTCALGAEGVARCVGENEHQQLAPGSAENARVADVVLGERIVDIAAGSGFTCALTEAGAVSCWGGVYTDPTTKRERPITGVTDATGIVVQKMVGCAILRDGDAACWGDATWLGKSGNPSETSAIRLGLNDVTSIAPAEGYVCVTRKGGAAQCKGDLPWKEDTAATWVPVSAKKGAGAAPFRRVSAAGSHACFETDGAPLCLGTDFQGTLLPELDMPAFARGARRVQAGGGRVCAIDAIGRVACWGHAYHGETGIDPDAPLVGGAVPVVGVSDAVDLALSDDHTCALESDGDVFCWGLNREGQLGDGKPLHRATPVDVGVFRGVTDIQGGSSETCLLAGGDISCWGGDNGPGPWPQKASFPDRVVSMDLGQITVCGLLPGGDVRCGFFNKVDRCKDQDNRRHCTLASHWDSDRLPALPGKATDFATDRINNVCALVGGDAHCLFYLGEAGGYHGDTWQKVPRVSGAVSIEATAESMCVIEGADRHVACFHDHRFDADQDFAEEAPNPKVTKIAGLTGVTALAGGASTFCALAGGALRCFEPDVERGTPTIRPTSAVAIDGLPQADAIAGADDMFCAIHAGKVHCWEMYRPGTVKTVPLPRPATRLGVGYEHACALTDDEHLWCWGHDEGGQLGVGRVAMSYRPIRAEVLR